ncbi:MAG: FtsX-like permease family protein, partial [Gammaproteobacteria bacterium]|nr:FtsX-like permease family protein [Gammaproteobacteria bacterium]
MLKNYLIVALRISMRNKLFSFINIGGLTIGLTAAFLIILFVQSEMGYDRLLSNNDRIYTVQTHFSAPGRAPNTNARTPRELKAAMEKDFADIGSFTRFYAGSAPVKIANDLFVEKSYRIEETFFDVFNYPFLEGNGETALDLAFTAVVSNVFANKHFPGQAALGKTVSIGDQDYAITGVLEEPAGKTHMDFEILIFNGPGALDGDFIDWTSSRLYSYFILADGGTINNMTLGTADFLDRNAFFAPESWQDYKPSDVMNLSYMKIADIHLYQNTRNTIGPNGSATLVYGFIGIAALIMIMASINFINLSTAGASAREKEIAMHKVVGAKRSQLITRYLFEALTLVSFAFILSLALTALLAPMVFNWIGLVEIENTRMGSAFIIIAAASSLITGFLAGLYPAFHLSSKSPASAFSGGRSQSPRVARFRIGLIFFQYTISIILMIAAGHFYLQTRLATTMDLGFNDENVLAYWGVGAADEASDQQALAERI